MKRFSWWAQTTGYGWFSEHKIMITPDIVWKDCLHWMVGRTVFSTCMEASVCCRGPCLTGEGATNIGKAFQQINVRIYILLLACQIWQTIVNFGIMARHLSNPQWKKAPTFCLSVCLSLPSSQPSLSFSLSLSFYLPLPLSCPRHPSFSSYLSIYLNITLCLSLSPPLSLSLSLSLPYSQPWCGKTLRIFIIRHDSY